MLIRNPALLARVHGVLTSVEMQITLRATHEITMYRNKGVFDRLAEAILGASLAALRHLAGHHGGDFLCGEPLFFTLENSTTRSWASHAPGPGTI